MGDQLKASILLLQEAASHLLKGSSVVLFSFVAAYQPSEALAMYGVTKNSHLGLTKALAAEMAPNCVAPGFVPTHLASAITSNESMERGRTSRRHCTTGLESHRIWLPLQPIWLASYVTGETLVVAGGTPSRF